MIDNPNEEAVRGQVMVNGSQVETFKKEIIDCNVIEVEVGTTGYCGGDTGHGGRTYFKIANVSSTDMSCRIQGRNKVSEDYLQQIELMFGGDAEMETFIEALEFALDVLKSQAGGRHIMTTKELKQDKFRCYLSELILLYAKTGKLSGMSEVRKKYGTSGITKTNFFEFGLNDAAKDNVSLLESELSNQIYQYVNSSKKDIPMPKYQRKSE